MRSVNLVANLSIDTTRFREAMEKCSDSLRKASLQVSEMYNHDKWRASYDAAVKNYLKEKEKEMKEQFKVKKELYLGRWTTAMCVKYAEIIEGDSREVSIGSDRTFIYPRVSLPMILLDMNVIDEETAANIHNTDHLTFTPVEDMPGYQDVSAHYHIYQEPSKFDDWKFENNARAYEFIGKLMDIGEKNGVVRISDVVNLFGQESKEADELYGWKDEMRVVVKACPCGTCGHYVIDFGEYVKLEQPKKSKGHRELGDDVIEDYGITDYEDLIFYTEAIYDNLLDTGRSKRQIQATLGYIANKFLKEE